MNSYLKFIFCIAFLAGLASCQVLPTDRCKLTDSTCMTTAFQNAMPIFMEGVPDLGIEVLDTMEMDDIAFDLSGLQFTLKEGRLKGLKGSIIDKANWNEKKKRIEVDFHMNCTIKGHYTAAGRLLILPISGDGQLKLKLRNVVISLYIDYKMETAADGKEHVKPVKYEFKFDVIDNAHFNLTGLFNGNKQLSDTMLAFLNDNWKQISLEFGRPMIDSAAKKIFKNVVQFFSLKPIGDISDL